jgi:hypothetical protein
MANALVTSTIVTNEVLRIAHNNSAFLGNMNSDYKDGWTGEYKPGGTLKARRPVQFTHRSGATANIQDVTESSVDILVQPELGIDFAVSNYDLATAVGSNGAVDGEFKRRYLQPAGLKIAAILDYSIATIVKNASYNIVGSPGTGPSTIADILNAKVPAQNQSVPPGDYYAALSPTANAAVVAGLATLYNDQKALSDQYKTGLIKTALGIDFLMSQNVPSHTVGPLGGTPAVNGANQGLINAGSTDNPYAATTSLITNGWTAAAAARLKQGDVFTIAGVNTVNPETKADTGSLQNFVVTADVSSDVGGNLTAVISPAIIAGGAFQNVTARPASGALLTIKTGTASTTYAQNVLWHRDSITFVSPKQELPGGMDMAYQASMADEGGLSLRFVRGFDITNNRFISRFDVLWGAAVTKPEWVVRRTS